MEKLVKVVPCLLVLGSLSGCAGYLIEYGSYIGEPTAAYEATSDPAQRAEAEKWTGSKFWYFPLGESRAHYTMPTYSKNMLSAGPVLPVIPVPGKGEYKGGPFVVSLHIKPGRKSFVVFDPYENLIIFEGSREPVAPSYWSGCKTAEEDPRARAYGWGCTVKLYFDGKTTMIVDRFVLLPGSIDADEVIYVLPKIQYERGKYRAYE